MALLLDYHSRRPQQRRWLVGIILLAIIVSAILAAAKLKAFKARQERRAEIRRQFDSKMANARSFLNQNKLEDAAGALIQGEFPVHIEPGLFRASEIESFNQQTEGIRQQIDPLIVTFRRNQEAMAEQVRKQQELERNDTARNEIVRRIDFDSPRSNRQRTIVALELRAKEQLWMGNKRQALAICRQVVELNPAHRFDDRFWKCVRDAPSTPRHFSGTGFQNTPSPF